MVYANGKNVTGILPTLNEAGNIERLITEIRSALPEISELIVVDDNSKDGTPEQVQKLQAALPGFNLKLIQRTKNFGLTPSLQEGIDAASGEVVFWMDCDLSMPPELLPQLLKAIDDGHDVGIGSRFVPGGSFKKGLEGKEDSLLAVLLSRIMNYSIQLLLNHRFRDYSSGYIAIRTNLLKSFRLQGDYGEYFIFLMAQIFARKARFIEIPYICIPREWGHSKTGDSIKSLLKRGSKYVKMAFVLAKNRAAKDYAPPAPLAHILDSTIQILPATREDIPFLASLHREVLGQTFSSLMGEPFLQELYWQILDDADAGVLVAKTKQGRLVGFVSMTARYAKTQAALSISSISKLNAIKLCLLHPRLVYLFLKQNLFRFRCRALTLNPDFKTILTLGVDPEFRSKGIAKMLISAADGAMLDAKGATAYFVDTEAANQSARKFYRSTGFNELKQIFGNVLLRKDLPPEIEQAGMQPSALFSKEAIKNGCPV